MRERIVAVVVGVLLTVLAPAARAQMRSEQNRPADQALAARISGVAQQLLRSHQLSAPVFQQAAILFAASARLDPQQERYWRLLAEAEIEAGNREGAIAALEGLENVDPRNTIPAAWMRMIDLYLEGMQQVPQQLAYLERIYQQETVPASIRAHAAYRAADLRLSQAAPGLALEWVEKALELNPVNAPAARLRWTLVADSDDLAARIKALQTLVHADPTTPANVATLADQLAHAGFYDAALTWYALAIQLAQRAGVNDSGLVFDYAAELFIADDPLSAGNLVRQLLTADPQNIDALFLQLLLDREKPRDLREQTQKTVRQSLLDRLDEVRKTAGMTPAAGALDLSADLKHLQQADAAPGLKAAYASAVGDLIWFDLYFSGPSESTDELLDFLRTIAPADSATVARLDGWNFLLRNRPDEARVKLEAAANRDPLAQLGLLRMVDRNDDAAMQKMTEAGRKLLSEHPAGLVGAFLASELRQFGVRVQPHASVEHLMTEVRNFSRDWPQIYTNPAAFYTVRVQPLKVSHQIGEPILARVEIQNNSTQYPLSVDALGAIRPDLWFDVQIRGAIQQYQSGVAYDRLLQDVVLQPRQSLSQIVRLDRGGLAELLDGNPQLAFPMTFTLVLNPQTVQVQEGATAVVPGLLGQAVPFARIINREAGQPTPNTVNDVTNNLRAGLPEKKIEAIDYMRTWVPVLRQQMNGAELPPEQKQELQRLIGHFVFEISRARQDPLPAVAAWASYSAAMIAEPEQRAEVLRQMRATNNPGQMLLSLLAAQQLDPALAQDVANRLKDSDEPMVQRLAVATLAAAQAAATQPAPANEGAAPTK